MIISSGRRYIFVHIPKTGGTALSAALETRAKADDILIGDTPKAIRRRERVKSLSAAGRLWKHSTLRDIEGLVPREDFDDFFIFTLVRNPWDRAVSYYHWLRDQTWDHDAVRLAKVHTFSDFLNAPETREALGVPYGSYLRDGEGQERGTHFARIEALETDLVPLWEHLGFDLSPIPQANASVRDSDYRGYYSAADAELIARICATDIARFGYGFDDPIAPKK
ncbi:sulfotransferase family 2 domain-containing protein [Celeribacter litoreus]|uniref:sulfotransferase family 2 domain-containing protein n=1 Tax=Celeribacter litoreus TaxID=2876714 RepID=UPI001CCB67B8|nr:sulfotransferase family 2 domain-containing protein [Celeribacter litoreus]MCA0042860.1 sulfotransferase family protein [Celeribacter litoreus]